MKIGYFSNLPCNGNIYIFEIPFLTMIVIIARLSIACHPFLPLGTYENFWSLSLLWTKPCPMDGTFSCYIYTCIHPPRIKYGYEAVPEHDFSTCILDNFDSVYVYSLLICRYMILLELAVWHFFSPLLWSFESSEQGKNGKNVPITHQTQLDCVLLNS